MKRKHASFLGSLARECIRHGMHSKKMRNGGYLVAASKLAEQEMQWKAPKDCTLDRFELDGIPMEMLKISAGLKDKVILQFHGGAYLIGFMDMYRRIAYRYARLSGGANVLSVDYRIAPEYQHPAALEDAFDAWNWLLESGYKAENIIIAGDSAGGNLALTLTLKLRDSGMAVPRALVLMSPWADMSGVGESRKFNFKRDPMFGESAGDESVIKRREPGNPYAGETDLKDPYLSPVYADFMGFPPMLIQVGDWEMLLSEARTVAEKARAQGIRVVLTEYPGMFHMFQMSGMLLPESRSAWREAGAYIRACFGVGAGLK